MPNQQLDIFFTNYNQTLIITSQREALFLQNLPHVKRLYEKNYNLYSPLHKDTIHLGPLDWNLNSHGLKQNI